MAGGEGVVTHRLCTQALDLSNNALRSLRGLARLKELRVLEVSGAASIA